MQNRVSMIWADQDVINLTGFGTYNYVIGNGNRFNGQANAQTGNNDKFKFNRYFTKGGLYKVRFIYTTDPNGGKIDIGLDSSTNNIFSQIDSFHVTTSIANNVIEKVIEVSRGYHDITFLANGKNAGSGAYFILWQALEFDLIQEYAVYQDSPPAQINQGSMVLLAKHDAIVAESTWTANLGDINNILTKYSKIVVEIEGGVTASLALQMTLNGISTSYYSSGFYSTGAALTNETPSSNVSQWVLISTNILTGVNFRFSGKVEIKIPNVFSPNFQFDAISEFMSNDNVYGERLQHTNSNNITNLSSITVKTSTSTWLAGTRIYIYGVKRQ